MHTFSFRVLAVLAFVVVLLALPPAARAEGPCLCNTQLGITNFAAGCYSAVQNDCPNLNKSADPTYSRFVNGTCSWKTDNATCDKELNALIERNATMVKESNAQAEDDGSFHIVDKKKFGACGANGSVVGTSCGDVSIFIQLLFQVTDWLFGIIGALALLMFVYGGFTFILSQGNAERVQQGKSIFLAAVIGLVVAFGGYVLVKFVATALGVDSAFILK